MISSYDEYMQSHGGPGLVPINTPSSKEDYAQFMETYEQPVIQPQPVHNEPQRKAQSWRKRVATDDSYGDYENDYQSGLNNLEESGPLGEKRSSFRNRVHNIDKPEQVEEEVNPEAEDQIRYKEYLREYNMQGGF